MSKMFVEALTEFIKLLGKAFDGDEESIARVDETLPHLKTKMAKARHEAAATAKFGPRPTEDS